MPFVQGFLNVVARGLPGHDLPGGERPVDPGWGIGEGGEIDNTLPPGFPPIGGTLPEQPPGVWPPISWNHPWFPLPPDSAVPPGAIWPPPGGPPHPWDPIPPDASTKPPAAGGTPPVVGGGPVLPPPHDGKFWVVAGIPGVGWRYVCVDITLRPDVGLPPGPPNRVDNTLPPTAQPRG